MHKNATKCNETLSKWCKNKHGASKIIDTFETYHSSLDLTLLFIESTTIHPLYLWVINGDEETPPDANESW
jgi:hypothetical protein